MSSPDYYPNFNGPAATQRSEDLLVTYCLTLIFIVFCVFPLFMHFKDSIFCTFSLIGDSIHHISLYIAYIFNTCFGLYTIWKELQHLQPQDQHFQQPRTEKTLIQIPPPLDEFLTEVREQLTVLPSTSPIQEIQPECCDSQVFETEQLFSHTPNILIECTYDPLVVCNNCAFTKFIQEKERCLKFISQD